MKIIILLLVALMQFSIANAQLKGIGQKEPSKGQKKANYGQYVEEGDVPMHPYTIFFKTKSDYYEKMKSTDDIELLKERMVEIILVEIGNIQTLILKDVDRKYYKKLYETQIFVNADDPTDPWNPNDKIEIGGHGVKNEVSKSVTKCKNAAFVFLMGFDQDGSTAGFRGTTDHTNFKRLAIDRLLYMNVDVGAGISSIQWRTKELILYLQAYDLLRTAEMIGDSEADIADDYTFSQQDKEDLETIKYQLQRFARNMYRKSKNIISLVLSGGFDANNNHSVMDAAAVGLAAIVLNDCGHRWYKKNWKPEKWANAAHFVINRTLWTANSPQSSTNFGGYAEGPLYFRYCFENAVPFFRAFSNYVPKNFEPREYKYRDLINSKQYVKNYNYNSDYDELYEWNFKITQPNDTLPNYDDTRLNVDYGIFNVINGVEPRQDFHYYTPTSYGSGINLAADYLAYGLEHPKNISTDANVYFENSGDLILRTGYDIDLDESRYLHVLAEKGTAVNGGAHEHSDLTSFMLLAGKDILALDPGYIEEKGIVSFLNLDKRAEDHNLITVNGDGPNDKTEASSTNSGETKTSRWYEINSEYKGTDFTRKVEMHNIEGYIFYVITDNISRKQSWLGNKKYTWNLNGNGNEYEYVNSIPSFDFINSDMSHPKWTHPCRNWSAGDPVRYNLLVVAGVAGGGGYYSTKTTNSTYNNNSTIHLNDGVDKLTNTRYHFTSSIPYGVHTRYQITKWATDTKFKAVLWPYKCGETPPLMILDTLHNDVNITIKGIGTDGIDMVFKTRDTYSQSDTNPFYYSNCTAVLEYEAENIMLAKSSYNSKNFANCTANTNFRKAYIDNGTLLKYFDTVYIESQDQISISYELIGKFKYSGVANNESGSDIQVTLFLPDLLPQYDMIAWDYKNNASLTYSYDNGQQKITVTFPEGVTHFELKLEDPCLASCFFPSTIETIDTLFDFNTGTREHLGHNLDILEPNGHLKITKGSKVDICSNMTLVNKDSITMLGLWVDGDQFLPLYTEYGENQAPVTTAGELIVDNRFGTKKSMIIIRDQAALVLEPNSYTHIGANSTILVKNGGTLLIQNEAFVEIGSKDHPGYAEIIAEDGAFICVEEGADIHFYSNENDSSDKNIAFFFNPSGDTIYLSEGGIKSTGVLSGTNTDNHSFNPDSGGVYTNVDCIDLCEIKDYLTPYGINNREFGWSNINEPLSFFEMRDTICEGGSFEINGIETLNETKWKFKICKWDVQGGNCIDAFQTVPYPYDTTRLTSYNLGEDFTFEANENYMVKLFTSNDCQETDILSHIVYVKTSPSISFDLPDSACPGTGTVQAIDGNHSTTCTKHKWSVSMLNNADYHDDDTNAFYNERSYEYSGSVEDTFSFPGFRFYGGYDYVVQLSIYTFCGVSTFTDTISIPLSAYIFADKTTIFRDGIGDTSVQLNGAITGTSSFSWNPTSTLTDANVLNPIAFPSQTTSYILSVSDGATCTDADTITIKVNLYANAGLNDTICIGDSVLIGTINGNMPPSYTYSWSPDSSLSNGGTSRPYAKPIISTSYTLSIKDSNNTTVETDIVTVFVDSVAGTEFIVDVLAYYDDSSTFHFENTTEPFTQTTKYIWTFSDGDTSYLINPTHTFLEQSVDTYYVICLTALNKCGDSTYCDTLFYLADSNAWQFFIANATSIKENKMGFGSYIIGNIPNPFKDQTTIKYHLAENAANAEIVIYNMFGKHVKTIKLRPNSDTYNLDWSAFAKGIYSYSLLIDGILKDSKKMIKL